MSAFSGKVLVAVDGSAESIRAARMAAKLSESLGSALHVVHVGPVLKECIERPSLPKTSGAGLV
jgi:nucleotide-binding universal stress UspA family protein